MKERRLQLNYPKYSVIFLLAWFLQVGNTQTSVKIIDQSANELIGALVQVERIGYVETSDMNGEVVLPDGIETIDNISVSYLSFEDALISYEDVISQDFVIMLKPSSETLEEVILIGRNQKIKSDALLPVEIIDERQISLLQVQTPADLLEKQGSVFVQKSQMGGGSPVVRGFEANKVLLVLDGVRLNNAIYRSGHLQSSITLDEQMMETVEVLFGPGSILYGSDAIGGVVHYRTKTPKLSESYNDKINLMTRFSSSNNEKTGHVNYQFGSPKFSGLMAFTFSDYGNLKSGGNFPSDYPNFGKRPKFVIGSDDPGDLFIDEIDVNPDPTVQVGTQYSQQDYFAKFKYQASETLSFVLNNQFSTSSNIPRYDRLIEEDGEGLKFSEWYYGPQERILVSLITNYSKPNKLADELHMVSSFQKIKESRISRDFGSLNREQNFEDLDIFSFTLDLSKYLSNKFTIDYGIDYQYNGLISTASENIFTRYPNGNNNMALYGIYGKASYELSRQFTWNNGLRYSLSKINLDYERDAFFDWPDYFYNGIENETSSLNYLTSLNYSRESFKLNLIGGTAFRAPNIDDLAKVRVKATEITIPNPELKPEKTLNAEVQLYVGNKQKHFGLSVFGIGLKDAIVRQNFQLTDGSDIYVNNGDSLAVTANVNANKARVIGFTLKGHYSINDQIGIKGNINYTKGTREAENGETAPLDHIPPLFGNAAINYEGGHWSQSLVFRFNGKKPLDLYGGSADNPELATLEGALAWHTLNYYMDYKINDHLSILGSVENIFDIHYRTFSSGLSSSGRNFILTLRAEL